jgi:hypothetical protein
VEGWRPVGDIVRWGFGQTAGILRAQAPPPLDERAGVDALVVSTDNELTGTLPAESGPTEDGA